VSKMHYEQIHPCVIVCGSALRRLMNVFEKHPRTERALFLFNIMTVPENKSMYMLSGKGRMQMKELAAATAELHAYYSCGPSADEQQGLSSDKGLFAN
jgi:hypothetical protein